MPPDRQMEVQETARAERFRIVQEMNGIKVPVAIGPGDEDFARNALAWHRGLAPVGMKVTLQRQDLTPRPWEELNG